MIAAGLPDGGARRLLAVDRFGIMQEHAIAALPEVLRAGDLVVANDAATLPASLHGRHVASGSAIEVRLAAWVSPGDPTRFIAIVFGAGDFRTRTEDRAPPPLLNGGDRLVFGDLQASVERMLDHPRLIELRFDASADIIWSALARHGRPVQYAHVNAPLVLWDVWTKVAGRPFAFEAPSAGFSLSWAMLEGFVQRGIGFATLTHAAGISSTGDVELDKRLPFDEAYEIPERTIAAIRKTKAEGGRIIAIGTSVVRALEHAAKDGALRAGPGVATGRLSSATALKLVDAIISGVHAPGESHFELLRAFASVDVLDNMAEVLERRGFRNHEFGDFVMIERGVLAAANIRVRDIAASAAGMRYLRA